MQIPAGTRFGAYEILELVGSGGMGAVYRARDPQLKRDVAIKILPHELSNDPDRINRFRREAEILASLNHPLIAGIYDIARREDTHFIVMELVEGQTIADRLAASGRIGTHEALLIARQIAEALETAHHHGIVHRDLKPANIKWN